MDVFILISKYQYCDIVRRLTVFNSPQDAASWIVQLSAVLSMTLRLVDYLPAFICLAAWRPATVHGVGGNAASVFPLDFHMMFAIKY